MKQHYSSSHFKKEQGVSLIEIMMTISILSIIMFVGIPSFQNFFESARNDAVSEGVVSALQLARSEALRRGETVILCQRTENAGVAQCEGNGGDWSDGWLLTDANNTVIRDWRMRGDINVNVSSNGVATSTIAINSRGMLDRNIHNAGITLLLNNNAEDSYFVRTTGVITHEIP